ncbi:hypothetical protein [Pedobacter roseus]|uniref:Uncharacterized protein n=1 Tax=Pedobacter roseus TaxID=336820 RepID=A0A7G9QJ93_9SPHI|nr:hypothetical protein [Pedobacter roseus]QNN43418.1 hypothetical protein H9L23_04765 [Pedobacter roseus]
MGEKRIIPLVTKEGHNYLIQFEFLDKHILPKSLAVDVVDVLISVENNVGINNGYTLSLLAEIMRKFILENNVILYCYCDHAEIVRSDKRRDTSPQEYRSLLFSAMFAKQGNDDYVNQLIVINDKVDHYIHLISNINNVKDIELLKMEVSSNK